MNSTTHLGKIIEFLHKTQLIEKVKSTEQGTLFVTEALSHLALNHNWDVDAAINMYKTIFEDETLEMDATIYDFDFKIFLEYVEANVVSDKYREKLQPGEMIKISYQEQVLKEFGVESQMIKKSTANIDVPEP